jgi:carboxylate-amine ligase
MTLSLFEGVGIELEYHIVDSRSGRSKPLCAEVLSQVSGGPASDYDDGAIAWSNELVQHVIELKTNGPAANLTGLAAAFQASAGRIQEALDVHSARLCGGGMHPTFDPTTETKLWEGDYSEVYATYDRIFGCKGHGWSNLQSTHINLPFADDAEFRRLHAAVRVVLPLIPGLSAASAYVEGRRAGPLDQRLFVYRDNSRRVPSMTGWVVPEPCGSQAEFERTVLDPIHAELAPLDPAGVLRGEWVNARGAIPRFDRGAIEIRVIDAQECPVADIAIVGAVCAAVRALANETWADLAALDALPTPDLADQLWRAAESGAEASVHHSGLLRVLGQSRPMTLGELWRALLVGASSDPWIADAALEPGLALLLEGGTLGSRSIAQLGATPGPGELRTYVQDLADCMARGRRFLPSAD